MSERVRGIALNTLNLTSSDSTTINSGNTGQRKYILGVFVSSVSGSPTLALADSAKTIAAQFTPAAATWYPMPVVIDGALSITIGATLNCTVFYGSE